MSERERDGSLTTLPRPTSPKALDDRILAAAREHAPSTTRRHNFAWVSGMASACLLVVAVLITGVPNPFMDSQVASVPHDSPRYSKERQEVRVSADGQRESSQLSAGRDNEPVGHGKSPAKFTASPSALTTDKSTAKSLAKSAAKGERMESTSFTAGLAPEQTVLEEVIVATSLEDRAPTSVAPSAPLSSISFPSR